MSGRPDAARQRAEAAMVRRPKSADVILLGARTYSATGDVAKAEETLKRALTLDPDNVEIYGMLGQLLYQQGRLEEGRKEFEKVVSQQPRNVAVLTMLGLIARRQGKPEEAMQRYERILTIDGDAVMAANNLAYLYAEHNRNLDKAIELASIAQKKLPNDPNAADTLGWVYVRKGLATVGLRFLEMAVQKMPNDAQFRYHLGAAYAQLKDTDKAKVQLEQALKLDEKFEGSGAARSLLASLK